MTAPLFGLVQYEMPRTVIFGVAGESPRHAVDHHHFAGRQVFWAMADDTIPAAAGTTVTVFSAVAKGAWIGLAAGNPLVCY